MLNFSFRSFFSGCVTELPSCYLSPPPESIAAELLCEAVYKEGAAVLCCLDIIIKVLVLQSV